jgi:putative ATPase
MSTQPLAARLRPRSIEQFIGQEHILGPNKPLRIAIEQGHTHSMVFWGPPGCGKTTLAKLVAESADAVVENISAVLGGVKDIRAAVDNAKKRKPQQTIVFVDEVHRFNKAQQDAFLPFIEDGTILFIGATTENPSFELNNALLSRTRVYVLKSLNEEALLKIIEQAIQKEGVSIADEYKRQIAMAADGDARNCLNYLQLAIELAASLGKQVDKSVILEVISSSSRRFDKQGEVFYDQISALHKSVRGSDPDASLYWLMRMLDGGCSPEYLCRRIVRMASEDIGNADPRALTLALNAWDAYDRLGLAEGELALAQAVVYLAVAAKSNALYTAYKQAKNDAIQRGSLEVPLYLRNAPTKLMKQLDYGKHYRYAHDEPHAYATGVHYFPENMPAMSYYHPTERGLELKIKQKLAFLKSLDSKSVSKE